MTPPVLTTPVQVEYATPPANAFDLVDVDHDEDESACFRTLTDMGSQVRHPVSLIEKFRVRSCCSPMQKSQQLSEKLKIRSVGRRRCRRR
jgi:hypothetical protein